MSRDQVLETRAFLIDRIMIVSLERAAYMLRAASQPELAGDWQATLKSLDDTLRILARDLNDLERDR